MDIQLIYASEATQEMSVVALDDLLSICVKHNAEKMVTGMLLYGRGKFMQVIEGAPDVIDTLMAKITADTRHAKVNVLVRTSIQHRDFKDWSMGFHRVEETDGIAGEHFRAFFDGDSDLSASCDHPSLALSILKSFAFPKEDFTGK